MSFPEAEKLLIVEPWGGFRARVRLLVREEGERRQRLCVQGFLGRNGVTSSKREGDGCTPAGVFSLDLAFGTAENPGARLPYKKLAPADYWVDDPTSPFYNQFVTWTAPKKPWNSAEHLIEEQAAYRYAANICCNPERVPGGGPRCSCTAPRRAYGGCVSVPEPVMAALLRELDGKSRIWIRDGKLF